MASEFPVRSLMFVPGHRQRMVERALGLGEFAPGPLDVAILDLEDGVPRAEKDLARALVAAALARPSNGRGPARFVRVNAPGSADLEADLAAIARPGVDAIVAPKIDRPADLERLAARIPPIPIVASIESARGLLEAPAIAASSEGVIALMFGAEDYALDLGLPTEREGEAAELLYARSAVVVAAVASRRLAIDGIWPNIDDADGLRRDSLRARRLGFAGKTCIHPVQIETINAIFSPSAPEIEHARRVLAAFDEATARGSGAVALDGKLIDPPIVERARRTLRAQNATRDK